MSYLAGTTAAGMLSLGLEIKRLAMCPFVSFILFTKLYLRDSCKKRKQCNDII